MERCHVIKLVLARFCKCKLSCYWIACDISEHFWRWSYASHMTMISSYRCCCYCCSLYYSIRREFSIIISACCRRIIYDLCLGSLKLASWNKTLSKMVPLLLYFVAPHRKQQTLFRCVHCSCIWTCVCLCVSILNILSQSFWMTRKRG